VLSLFQPAVSSPAVPWQRLLTVEILHRLPYRNELLTDFVPCFVLARHEPHRNTPFSKVNCSTITLVYHLGLYNRPEVAAVPGDVSPTPTKKNSIAACVFVAAGRYLSNRCPEMVIIYRVTALQLVYTPQYLIIFLRGRGSAFGIVARDRIGRPKDRHSIHIRGKRHSDFHSLEKCPVSCAASY
jgi:hypothetical protein